MRATEITLLGRVPSKKNSKIIARHSRSGKQMLISSNDYRKWHGQAKVQVFAQCHNLQLEGVNEVQMEWWMPDNRKTDLSNKAESVMDLLVDCKIIKDDSWQYIPRILLDCQGVDKEKPRVKIWILQR